MQTKQTKPYFDKLVEARNAFENSIRALGEMIAQELIAPVCEKHKLHFVSGMGVFHFYRKSHGNTIGAPTWNEPEDLYQEPAPGFRDLSKQAKADLEPILFLLNEEIREGGALIGHFVPDVR